MLPPKGSPLLFTLVGVTAIPVLHFLFPVWRIIPAPWTAFGFLFVLGGILLDLAADKLFHTHGTTVEPFAESQVLVVHGVFRITRNPMYLGFAMLLFGLAVMFGTASSFLVVLVFVVLIEKRFIRIEEKMLEQQFGRVYLGYKKYVRRWI